MKPKKAKSEIEKPTEETKAETPGQAGEYLGAEWTGGEALSPEFGFLEKGKIYPLPEDRAKISSGFKPVYKTEK